MEKDENYVRLKYDFGIFFSFLVFFRIIKIGRVRTHYDQKWAKKAKNGSFLKIQNWYATRHQDGPKIAK